MSQRASARELQWSGLPVSEGVASAPAVVLNPVTHQAVPWYIVEPDQIAGQCERAGAALREAAIQIDGLAEEVSRRIGKAQAGIFVAQKAMVEDTVFHEEICEIIRQSRLNAEAAVAKCLDRYETLFQEVDDSYLSERAADIGELRRRLLEILLAVDGAAERNIDRSLASDFHIIVAADLTPSDTVNLNTSKTLGFITEHGGRASHAAILARAMGIPSISGIRQVHNRITTGDHVLLDGDSGEVYVNPSPDTLALYPTARREAHFHARHVDPVEGFRVMGNIGLVADLDVLREVGAEGVGLYRTEFELLASSTLLGEDAQYERYAAVVDAMRGMPVYMRLLDLGADKDAPFLGLAREDNPGLGLRGARLLLERHDLLRPHVRALARAACHGPIHLTYPMVVDVDQFLVLRERVQQAIQDIDGAQLLHGVMFEVPSACLLAEEMLEVADFGTIGTNDLIQYLFAIDRNNENVAEDYDPDKPVFWNLLRQIALAARKRNKPLSVCGEIGGQPEFVSKLIDLGIRSVSVSPRQVGLARVAARQHLETQAAS